MCTLVQLGLADERMQDTTTAEFTRISEVSVGAHSVQYSAHTATTITAAKKPDLLPCRRCLDTVYTFTVYGTSVQRLGVYRQAERANLLRL